MTRTVLLSNHYQKEQFSILEGCFSDTFAVVQPSEVTTGSIASLIRDTDYLVASGRMPITGDMIKRAKKLKMISRVGVGVDMIDTEMLSRYSIPLYVNRGINSTSVAEHTILLILASLRRLPVVAANTKLGAWTTHGDGLQTHELANKKVCVVGVGSIGRKVSQLLQGFGCQVFECGKESWPHLEEYVAQSDVVTLHCPLTSQTERMVDAKLISKMKRGCVVINTARGGLVDEDALEQALLEGTIGFAALDVRSVEPPTNTSLACLNNVLLTPHIAGVTHESFRAMLRGAANCIVAFEEGRLADIEGSLFENNEK